MLNHLNKQALIGSVLFIVFASGHAEEVCGRAVPSVDAPLGKISFMRCDDPNYRYDPKQPYWHREWFEINGQKVLEAAKGESLFWTGEASKDKALWIFDATSLDYPRAKDPTGYGEISCSGSGRRGLYLVDLSKKPPKVIQFGVDKACNEFDWASWGTKNAVIALKKDVRFTYDRQTGKMSLPKDIDAIWEGMIIPTPTGKTSRDTPYPNYVKPYVKEIPLPAQAPK